MRKERKERERQTERGIEGERRRQRESERHNIILHWPRAFGQSPRDWEKSAGDCRLA